MNRFLPVILLLSVTSSSFGESFSELVGPARVNDVKWDQKSPISIPFITWGGDAATFKANGLSLTTASNSIYANLGVNLQLKNGDDFVQQVRDYMDGKSPFLRCTFHMLGMASEVLNQDAKTQPVCILQMTWSLGDHIVARPHIKTIADLKGTTGVIQQGGPHPGLVDDALKTAHLNWSDIKVKWAKDLTGTKSSPAEIFRNNPDVDWCTVISPDMLGLTGGLQSIGSGAEGTVKGARVVLSTAEMSRSITDMYFVRKDFYHRHKDLVHKFVAGYFMGVNEIVRTKKDYESKGSKEYEDILTFMQKTFGANVCPTLDPDAHGMILDLNWCGLPGNVAFFTEDNNPNGFPIFANNSLDLASTLGYVSRKTTIITGDMNFNRIAQLGNLGPVQVVRKERFNAEAVEKELESFNEQELSERTVYSFTINFEPNQMTFPISQYEKEFKEVASRASKFGNAVLAVRGHSDPSKTIIEMVRAGMSKQGPDGKPILSRSGTNGNYRYALNGKPFDVANTADIIHAIEAGMFDGVAGHSPKDTYTAAVNLSRRRAENFIDSLSQWSQKLGHPIDKSQIRPQGVGIREPFILKPRNIDDARQNMRVEIRLVRFDAEVQKGSDDFDF